ncbi:hypothetical protein NPIL_427371, partial [Nephila pilipes]
MDPTRRPRYMKRQVFKGCY